MIQLTSSHLQIIYNHAEGAYPEECCGILVGIASGSEKECVKVITTENAWNTQNTPDLFINQEASRNGRYIIAPRDLMEAQKQARQDSLNIIGIFHSHTDNLAIPSEFDREYAWQSYSYIIVSVYEGKARDVKSWYLDETHHFIEEVVRY